MFPTMLLLREAIPGPLPGTGAGMIPEAAIGAGIDAVTPCSNHKAPTRTDAIGAFIFSINAHAASRGGTVFQWNNSCPSIAGGGAPSRCQA